jgi:hypothetical protein
MDVRCPPRNLVAVLATTLSLYHLSLYHLSLYHLSLSHLSFSHLP